jgi:poly(3-hydroxybutyrate) depolymerase
LFLGTGTLGLTACDKANDATQAISLPGYRIDSEATSVSGLSSGAYLATQLQVAFSSAIKGAGIIAGGPYYCAQDSVTRATGLCTCTATAFTECEPDDKSIDVPKLIETTEAYARDKRIDATSNLGRQRVFLFSGTNDSVVPQTVMNNLYRYYQHFMKADQIAYNKDSPAQHAVVTDNFGEDCKHLGKPFINNCGYDTAGVLLQHIYGDLQPKNTGAPTGTLVRFNQAEFLPDPEAHSMDTTGWLYVPSSCANGEPCRVHIALHGCQQGQESVGKQFVEHAGYNAWADTNHLLILYPQAVAKLSLMNPMGCWNWWGYDNDAQYATRNGRQMRAIMAMVERLAGSRLTDARE